jgi:hypothetical protein
MPKLRCVGTAMVFEQPEVVEEVGGAEGRVLSRTRGTAQGVNLLQGFPAPFRLELKEQGGEVRVDLLYQYQFRDDSFDRLSRMLPSTITQQVRDACGSDSHRNRS